MRFRLKFFLSAAGAIIILGAGPAHLAAQTQTEAKIRLMADALTARDHGDYAAAKTKLEALQAIAPNDPNVRRILTDVTNRLAAQLAGPVTPPPSPPPVTPAVTSLAAPVTAVPTLPAPASLPEPFERSIAPASPGQVVMPVVRDEKPDLPVLPETGRKEPVSPEVMAAEAAAEALLHADDNHLSKLIAYVQAQRALARTQARNQDYSSAIETLDAALEELQKPVDDLRAERSDYVRRAKAASRQAEGPQLRHRR